jgi:hypothetical protein
VGKCSSTGQQGNKKGNQNMKTIMIAILAALITSTLQAEPRADDLFVAGLKVALVFKMDSHDCQGWQLALKRIRAAAGFARRYQQAAHETPNPQLMRVARALIKLNVAEEEIAAQWGCIYGLPDTSDLAEVHTRMEAVKRYMAALEEVTAALRETGLPITQTLVCNNEAQL